MLDQVGQNTFSFPFVISNVGRFEVIQIESKLNWCKKIAYNIRMGGFDFL